MSLCCPRATPVLSPVPAPTIRAHGFEARIVVMLAYFVQVAFDSGNAISNGAVGIGIRAMPLTHAATHPMWREDCTEGGTAPIATDAPSIAICKFISSEDTKAAPSALASCAPNIIIKEPTEGRYSSKTRKAIETPPTETKQTYEVRDAQP